MTSKPELMIFDMDGLLFDTERLFMNIRADVLREYGYLHRDEDYFRTIGTGGERLKQILAGIYGPDYPANEITDESRRREIAHVRKYGPPFKSGIRELLDYAKQKEIACCVATSTQRAYAEEFLELGGIRSYFESVICGDDVSHPKPDPEIFLTACSRQKTPPSASLVLEDSENGVKAAHLGGIPVICIPDMIDPSPEIAGLAAAVVPDASHVIAFLEN